MKSRPCIGIAIITYNRPEHLSQCLESILSYTASENTLVAVFDDCSEYNLEEVVRGRCVLSTGNTNRGVVHNKNRALFYFTKIVKAKYIILIEDDMVITSPEWLRDWKQACKAFGHINYTPPWFSSDSHQQFFRGGTGSALDPHRFTVVTGQCSAVRRSLIRRKVGYINPRFRGYGHGHVEWTNRLVSCGYGGQFSNGRREYFSISSGMEPLRSETFKNRSELDSNARVFQELSTSTSTIYVRKPWKTKLERSLFLSDFRNLTL